MKYKPVCDFGWGKKYARQISRNERMTNRGYKLVYEETLDKKSGIRSYQKYVERLFPEDGHLYVWVVGSSQQHFGAKLLSVYVETK